MKPLPTKPSLASKTRPAHGTVHRPNPFEGQKGSGVDEFAEESEEQESPEGAPAPRVHWFVGGALILAGLTPILVVLLLNPVLRVYSNHGFIHTSIIYRIVNGELPPNHPFLADQPLPYYWGYHLLAAQFVQLGMTPGWASTIINLVTLAATLRITWWIARKLTDVSVPVPVGHANQPPSRVKVALAASFGALCCPAFIPADIVADYLRTPLQWEFVDSRALPIVAKFVNLSGMPLGVLATVMWIASLIGVYESRRPRSATAMLGFSLWLCAFFYPPMLPTLVLGTPLVASLFILRSRGEERAAHWKRAVWICLVGSLSVVITLPYLLQVAESLRGSTRLFDGRSMLRSVTWMLVLVLPTAAFVAVHRKAIGDRIARIPLTVLLGTFSSGTLLFLLINQPLRTEYKYSCVALIALGFVGGAALALTWRRSSVASWIITSVFLVTPAYAFVKKLNYHTHIPVRFLEDGRDLHYTGNARVAEVFTWIRQNTSTESLFLDPTGLVPIYGQRGDLAAPNIRGYRGFGGRPYEFLAVHDKVDLERRDRVLNGTAPTRMVRQVLDVGVPVYRILDRDSFEGPEPDPALWEKVYGTDLGRFRIYSWLRAPK